MLFLNEPRQRKEHDPETGNDYFGARYYSSAMGRFLTPDWSATPVPIPYAVMGNPQTLNLYSYVENNPITGTDPDGHAGNEGPGSTGDSNACSGTAACDDAKSDRNDSLGSFLEKSAANALATVGGVVNAVDRNNGFNIGAGLPENSLGTAIGNGISLIQSTVEMFVGSGLALGGGTEAAVTAPAAGTWVGAIIPGAGVGVAIAGVEIAAHGTMVGANTLSNILNAPTQKSGFSKGVKEDAKAAADGNCQKCGTKTTPGQKSQKGVKPLKSEGQTDHIHPKSKGGTNDRSNAQHLCRECNIRKSDTVPNQ